MPEIDETELLQLRRLHGVAQKMNANPEAKKLLERAYKAVEPNAPTPALDQEKLIQEPLAEANKRIAALEGELKKDKEDRESASKLSQLNAAVESGFAKLRQEGWQDDGIKKVDELMKEKGILDPLIAAAYIEKQHPKQDPVTPSGSGSWNFIDGVQDGEADLKKLIDSKGQSEALSDKMARDALTEVRGSTRR